MRLSLLAQHRGLGASPKARHVRGAAGTMAPRLRRPVVVHAAAQPSGGAEQQPEQPMHEAGEGASPFNLAAAGAALAQFVFIPSPEGGSGGGGSVSGGDGGGGGGDGSGRRLPQELFALAEDEEGAGGPSALPCASLHNLGALA